MIWGCLLAVSLLGCLADGQFSQKPSPPQKPYEPQRPQPQKPAEPQKPREPQRTQPVPQKPREPQRPQTQHQKLHDQQKPQQSNQHLTQRQQDRTKKTMDPPDVFHSCDVNPQYKIYCGAPSISAGECEALNCCFDGHMCYYGKFGKYLAVSLSYTSYSDINQRVFR